MDFRNDSRLTSPTIRPKSAWSIGDVVEPTAEAVPTDSHRTITKTSNSDWPLEEVETK